MIQRISFHQKQLSPCAAQVAILKHHTKDNAGPNGTKRKGTKKVEFNAFICSPAVTSINAPGKTSLAANFGISLEVAPREIFKKGVTFYVSQLYGPDKIAMVRFRCGKHDGIAYADIINAHLQHGKFSWTDALIVEVARKIGANLKRMKVSGVGGFEKLGEMLEKNHDREFQSRLLSKIKSEFVCMLPTSEGTLFPA